MTMRNAFEGLATDSTAQAISQLNDTMLVLLNAILEKMPRVDANDRLMVNPTEVSSPVTGTVVVSSVTSVTTQANIGGRDAAHVAYALANSGALHIYDNIRVS